MIFNDEIAFLHVPKMGGMSVTRYLLNNLEGDIHLVVPEESFEHARRSIEFDDVHGRLHLHVGRRHENLAQATALLRPMGFAMDRFKKVLAIIRNPYTLERSYFLHLRKASTRNLRGRHGLDVQLADAGDFGEFCRRAPFYGKLPSKIERYYTTDGEQRPGNLTLVRFESMQSDLDRELEGFSLQRSALRHLNASDKVVVKVPDKELAFDVTSEQAVYLKYQYLFNFYERGPASAAPKPHQPS